MNIRRIITCGSWSLLMFLNGRAEDQTGTHEPQPAPAEQAKRLPQGVPPLLCEAVAKVGDADQPDAAWTLSLTLLRNTWEALSAVMPGIDWSEMKWEKVRPGVRSGTLTVPMGKPAGPLSCRVVDKAGKEQRRDQIIQQLAKRKRVLFSASGQMPDAVYLGLAVPGTLIVLLGPGDAAAPGEATAAPASKSVESVAREDEKKWTEAKSKAYFYELTLKGKTFKKLSEREASNYLHGIWRLDKRAHIGEAHDVRAEIGDDLTVICTDEWLICKLSGAGDRASEDVTRIKQISVDEQGDLHVKAHHNTDNFDHFRPLGPDHMAVAAYDFIAIVKRIR